MTIKVNIKDKKCRYCGKPATQGEILTAHAFPFTGPTHEVVHYYCDAPFTVDCNKKLG